MQWSHLFPCQFWSMQIILQGLCHILFGEREAKEDDEQVIWLCFWDLCLPAVVSTHFDTNLGVFPVRFKPLGLKKKKKKKREKKFPFSSHQPWFSMSQRLIFSPLEEGWMTRYEEKVIHSKRPITLWQFHHLLLFLNSLCPPFCAASSLAFLTPFLFAGGLNKKNKPPNTHMKALWLL